MRSLQQFWSLRRIGEDRVTLARLGPLRLWLARAECEWGYAYSHGEERDLMDFAQVPGDVVPEKLDWACILFRQAPRDYKFEAVAPTRPLTLRTLRPISLPGGESASFYAVIPVIIRIRVLCDGKSQSLGAIPTEQFYKSWFGPVLGGHLTYANAKVLMMGSEQIQANPNEIVYPVEIRNASSKMLRFDKICLNLSQTGLYAGTVHMWGSPVRVEFFGPNKECTVTCEDIKPDKEKDVVEVVAPSKSETRDMARLVISCCNSI